MAYVNPQTCPQLKSGSGEGGVAGKRARDRGSVGDMGGEWGGDPSVVLRGRLDVCGNLTQGTEDYV